MPHTPMTTCFPPVSGRGGGGNHNQTTVSSTSSSVNVDPVYEGIDAPKFVNFLVSSTDAGVDDWFEQQAAKGCDGSGLSEVFTSPPTTAAGRDLLLAAPDSPSLSTADDKENRSDVMSQSCKQELPLFCASGDQSNTHTTTGAPASVCSGSSSVDVPGQGLVSSPAPAPPLSALHNQMATNQEIVEVSGELGEQPARLEEDSVAAGVVACDQTQSSPQVQQDDDPVTLPSTNLDEEGPEEGEIVEKVAENGPMAGGGEQNDQELSIQSVANAPPAPLPLDGAASEAIVDTNQSQALLLAVPVGDQNLDMTAVSESVSIAAAGTPVTSGDAQVFDMGTSSPHCSGVEHQESVTPTRSEEVGLDTAVGASDTPQPAALVPTDAELSMAEQPARGQPGPEQNPAVGLFDARQGAAQRPPTGRPPLPTATAASRSRPLSRTAAQATARLAQGSTVASMNRRAASPVLGAGRAGVSVASGSGAAALPRNPQHKPAGFVPPMGANAHKKGPVRASVPMPLNVSQANTRIAHGPGAAATGASTGMSVSGRRADSRERAKLAQLGAGLAGLRVPHSRPPTKAGGPQLLTMMRSNSRDVIVRQKQAATASANSTMQSTAAGAGPLAGAKASPKKTTKPEPFKFMSRPPKPQMVHAPKWTAATSSSSAAAASASAAHAQGHSARARLLSSSSVGSASGMAGSTVKDKQKGEEKKGGEGGAE